MMTAERRDEGERIQLTSKQKFDRIREKMIVEVRLVSAANIDEKWLPAKVVNKNRGGVFAKLTTSPLERFWHFHDVRLIEEAPSTTATVGEIVRANSAPELPRREPLPPPPALVAALVPRPAAAPPAPLVPLTRPAPEPAKEALSMPESRYVLPNRISVAEDTFDSEVGKMIREGRLKQRVTQTALEQALSARPGLEGMTTNKRISSLECGRVLATDDELIGVAEALAINLDALIAARDRDKAGFEKMTEARRIKQRVEFRKKQDRERQRERREAKAEAEGRPYQPRTSPYRTIERTAKRATGARFAELEDMVEALLEIVPMPADAEMRRAWFRCARELFRLSGGG